MRRLRSCGASPAAAAPPAPARASVVGWLFVFAIRRLPGRRTRRFVAAVVVARVAVAGDFVVQPLVGNRLVIHFRALFIGVAAPFVGVAARFGATSRAAAATAAPAAARSGLALGRLFAARFGRFAGFGSVQVEIVDFQLFEPRFIDLFDKCKMIVGVARKRLARSRPGARFFPLARLAMPAGPLRSAGFFFPASAAAPAAMRPLAIRPPLAASGG